MTDEKISRMEIIISKLNEASEAYYGGHEEIMSNFEWDALFDELKKLEDETGVVLPQSPTVSVSYSKSGDISTGDKEEHEFPALSLAKTKNIDELKKWAGDMSIWLSWKLDGLTLVITYDNGTLSKILTRGNGHVGTNITFMKDVINGFPLQIDYLGHLVVRGEATISYSDFERINDSLDEDDEKYANPRNLASGTLSLDKKHLDTVKNRNLTFNAFTLVYIDEPINSWGKRIDWLDKHGFVTVERELINSNIIDDAVLRWTEKVEKGFIDNPVDGLVICYDDTDYAATGSVTGHHATRAGFAFKWKDESATTTLDHIEWSCAASVITPVAVFNSVYLEGTTVSRASLCNVTELERLGIGEDGNTTIEVIKANKIIPKVIAVKSKQGHFSIPSKCPVCGCDTIVKISDSGTKTLRCVNQKCPAKNLKKLERFVSKAGMDIEGISSATIKDFINEKMLSTYSDIYKLEQYEERICKMDGYGIKSCENIFSSIEKSRKTEPEKLIVALGIPNIGNDAAKKIISYLGWKYFCERALNLNGFEDIDGIGPERSNSVISWFANEDNKIEFQRLVKELIVNDKGPIEDITGKCKGLIFVITGEVEHFKNRDEFKKFVEDEGGKVTNSVSKKTDYLINNDISSQSSKNIKAKELGVPIISENDFIAKFK